MMNTQRELHTAIRKSAWIDAANRIVSFQQIGEASCIPQTSRNSGPILWSWSVLATVCSKDTKPGIFPHC